MKAIHLQEIRYNNLQDNLESDLSREDAAIMFGVAAKGIATAIETHHTQMAKHFEGFADHYREIAGIELSDNGPQTAPMSLRDIANHQPQSRAS